MTTYSELTDHAINVIVSNCYNINNYTRFPAEMRVGFYQEHKFSGNTEHPRVLIIKLDSYPTAVYSPDQVRSTFTSYLEHFYSEGVFKPSISIKPNGIFSFFDALNLFCFENIKFLISPIVPGKTIPIFVPKSYSDDQNIPLKNEITKLILNQVWIFDVIDYVINDAIKWHKGVREQIVKYNYDKRIYATDVKEFY